MSKTEIFLEDAQLAYAKAISNIFYCWRHDDDGGCDYDAVGKKQVVICNTAMLIYQPMGKKDEGWVENGSILIMPTKESGIKLNEALVKKTNPLFQEVENKLIDSYNGYVKKFGHWIERTNISPEGLNFKKITGIFDTIKFNKGVLKFKWEIKCLWEGPCNGWYPIELINWYKTLPSYSRFRYNNYRVRRASFEERLAEHIKNIKTYESNLLKLSQIKDPKDPKDPKIEELNTLIDREKKYKNDLDIALNMMFTTMLQDEIPMITSYSNEDDEYIKEWYEEQADETKKHYTIEYSKNMIAKELTYAEAFPDRKTESSLSGKKRKFESSEVSAAKRS